MPTGENTSVVNPWANVARVAPLTGDLVSLVEGSTFAISEPTGDMAPPGAQGLFHQDSRFLSRLDAAGGWGEA